MILLPIFFPKKYVPEKYYVKCDNVLKPAYMCLWNINDIKCPNTDN